MSPKGLIAAVFGWYVIDYTSPYEGWIWNVIYVCYPVGIARVLWYSTINANKAWNIRREEKTLYCKISEYTINHMKIGFQNCAIQNLIDSEHEP